jgi:hypothetical protein
MRSILFSFFLVACEQVAPSGNPLEPVPVAAQEEAASAPEADLANAGEQAEELADEEVFTISSEELAEAVAAPAPTDDAEASADNASVEGQEPKAAVPLAPPAAEHTQNSPRPGWPGQVANKWPVRLVTTIPNASPPRAILGLPDGREVVVNPGSMVPDLGIVVVAISPNSAELAKVAPAGDHATIESMTLTAQY